MMQSPNIIIGNFRRLLPATQHVDVCLQCDHCTCLRLTRSFTVSEIRRFIFPHTRPQGWWPRIRPRQLACPLLFHLLAVTLTLRLGSACLTVRASPTRYLSTPRSKRPAAPYQKSPSSRTFLSNSQRERVHATGLLATPRIPRSSIFCHIHVRPHHF